MTLYWKDTNGRSWPVCSCLQAWLPVYQAELKRLGVIKSGLDVFQTIGGAAASGGTHSTGQCVDTAQRSDLAIWVARQMGADASWNRRYNWDGRNGMAHAHLNLRGCPHGASEADKQYYSTFKGVDYGKNGLANGAADDGPRPLSKRTYTQGIAWAKARQTAAATPAITNYYVIGPYALGHQDPSATSRRVEAPRPWGSRVPVSKVSADGRWGWYDPDDSEGRWYFLGNLSKTKPTEAIGQLGTIKVAAHNVAAQAKDHTGTYPLRAPVSAERHVSSGAALIGVCEYGSGTTINPATGKTYLQISDAAREAINTLAGRHLRRMAHGGKWRYLLFDDDQVDYVENSGRSVTLMTHVDTDGTQVVFGAVWVFGVRVGICEFHFDVASTAAQLKAQAEETWQAGEAWRKEVGIRPWNMIYVGDENDIGTTVQGVFATRGHVSAALAPGAVGAEFRTTNSWKNALTVGPQRDSIFSLEGTVSGWQQALVPMPEPIGAEPVAADHQFIEAVREIYGTPTP